MATVRRTWRADPVDGTRQVRYYEIVYLRSWPVRTTYDQVVRDVRDHFERDPLPGSALICDKGGPGIPFLQILRTARPRCKIHPLIIHGGVDALARADGTVSVPKNDLVMFLVACHQSKRLFIAPTLDDARLLGKQLTTIERKLTRSGGDTFEAVHARDHDDLALAASYGVWYGEFRQRTPNVWT
jgi:hypothetical protein